MKQTLDEFMKAASEVSRLARKIDEESAPYKRMALRPRLRERFQEFMKEKGTPAGKAVLDKLGISQFTELKPEQYEDFIDEIGGI